MNKFFALLALLVITYVAVGLIMPTDEELRAYNVVSECWQEEEACKNSDNEKACTENVSRSCAVKHPEMYKIFDKKLARCSENILELLWIIQIFGNVQEQNLMNEKL